MRRPALHQLGPRRAPPLHRTLPTWARERTTAGIEYRLYVPSTNGIAVFTRDTFALDQTRAEVAALLRGRRRMLWGRDRLAPPETIADRRLRAALEQVAPDDESDKCAPQHEARDREVLALVAPAGPQQGSLF